MPNLSGSGGRSSGVNYATSSMFDRMYYFNLPYFYSNKASRSLALSYQAYTQAGSGSLARITRGGYRLL